MSSLPDKAAVVKVALSAGTIAYGRPRDGIGVYTAALAHSLPGLGLRVLPFELGRQPDWASRNGYGGYVLKDVLGLPVTLHTLADVVHFTDHRIVQTAQPSVATLHDAVPLKYPEWVSTRLRRVKNHVMKRMARHADIVVAVSQFAVTEVVEYFGVSASRIRVVHGGIGEQWLSPLPSESPPVSEVGIPLTDYFLAIGTFQPRKNLDRMLDAYLALPTNVRKSHPFVVVGKPGWRCEHTVARLQTLQADASSNVHWLRDIGSEAALRNVYRWALALSFVSIYEGFGIPVLEGFASGVPVITGRVSSLPEVAGQAAVLIDPLDTSAIARAMADVAHDPGLRAHLIQAGRERVLQFSWERAARALAGIYAELT